MTIQEQLVADQKDAMRSKDKATLNAIRSIQAEVGTAKAAPGFSGEVDDSLYVATITTYAKRISKSKDEYDAMGERGAAQSAKLAFELDYLDQFLPKKLDEAATRVIVDDTIGELGPDAARGQIIGAIMRSGQDVDGALVNRLVGEALDG
ncbi:MAG: GatB/YqeY domain-containing protein [Acidimicrobiia bacterium]